MRTIRNYAELKDLLFAVSHRLNRLITIDPVAYEKLKPTFDIAVQNYIAEGWKDLWEAGTDPKNRQAPPNIPPDLHDMSVEFFPETHSGLLKLRKELNSLSCLKEMERI